MSVKQQRMLNERLLAKYSVRRNRATRSSIILASPILILDYNPTLGISECTYQRRQIEGAYEAEP